MGAAGEACNSHAAVVRRQQHLLGTITQPCKPSVREPLLEKTSGTNCMQGHCNRLLQCRQHNAAPTVSAYRNIARLILRCFQLRAVEQATPAQGVYIAVLCLL